MTRSDPTQPDEALYLAAETGNLESVQSLLSGGAKPDMRAGEHGETPLMNAARWGQIGVARLLMAAGATVDCKTEEAWTGLHAACVGKHTEIVALLLDQGADPNVYSYHRAFDEQLGWHFLATPLHIAAANGSVEVAAKLLAKGASVGESWQEDRRTPIFYAAAYGHADMIALLCKHGADPNSREHLHEYTVFLDRTPLHYAARNGHAEATKVLLACGAEARAKESNSGQTALQMARAAKHRQVVEQLRQVKT
jgi:ankyrin repeat protein